MGSDLKTVNMARVSFKKRSNWEETPIQAMKQGVYIDGITDIEKDTYISGVSKSLSAKDQALINYLAKHKHWAPFAHNVLTVHVKAPIFVARQLFKHKVAFIESEVSRRYIDDEPEFYYPEYFRSKADNKKQGSLDTIALGRETGTAMYMLQLQSDVKALYTTLLRRGVCPEQARMVLPLNTYTEWYLTGSLPAFHRMYQLRTSEDAQKETQEIVLQLDNIITPLYPLSWKALKEHA